MDCLVGNLDSGKQAAGILAGEFVVIAGDKDHPGAGVHLAQDLRHHLALRLRPKPAALELPAIDDVAHQEQGGAIIVCQEIGQGVGLTAARSQMGVGDENRAMAALAGGVYARDGWGSWAGWYKTAQGIFEPRNIGHRVSPALLAVEIADPRESFVASLRQCDES